MEVAVLAVHAIHGAKISAARNAWKNLVAPLRAEVDDVRKKYAALLEQFQTVRAAYLKEVVMLRDGTRVRGDPESALEDTGKTLDVTAYFDPMCALLPCERDFAMQVVSEKLKMVFETNPGCVLGRLRPDRPALAALRQPRGSAPAAGARAADGRGGGAAAGAAYCPACPRSADGGQGDECDPNPGGPPQ
jgi:hypothetical protein